MLFQVYIRILGILVPVGLLVAAGVTGDSEKDLRNIIQKKLGKGWYKNFVNDYLNLFKKIYKRESPNKIIYWFSILFTYWLFVVIRISAYILGIPLPEETSTFLLLALGISTCSALGIYGIFRNKIIYGFFKTCNSKIKLPGRFGFWFWGITGSILFIILTIGISISVLYPTNVKILAFVSSLLVMPIEFILVSNQQSDKDVDTIFDYPVEQSESLKSGVSAVVALLLAILLYNIVVLGFSNYVVSQGSTRDLFSYAIVIAFAAAAVPAGIFYIITKLRKMKVSEDESIRKFVEIHPIYVMIFSIGWMLAFSWIKTDAARSFISSVQGGGLVLFSFLLFNMYADTISLVETNYILEYSKKIDGESSFLKKFRSLLTLVAIDIILSAGIYLFLPFLANQNMNEFVDGILFTGSSPWVGILFLSTFGTSIIFYLFVCSVIISKPIVSVLNKIRFFQRPDDYDPAVPIVISSVIIVTVIFLLISIISALFVGYLPTLQVGPRKY